MYHNYYKAQILFNAGRLFKLLSSVHIYRRFKIKHVLIQPPAENIAYKRVLKKLFLFDEGIHCCTKNKHLEVCNARFCVTIRQGTKTGEYAK